jgi:lipopolysaccharide export system protein LptC
MDVDGGIRDTLQAATMVHFADDDRTEVEQPLFVSVARGAPLSIASKRALVSSNGGNLYFYGDVRASRAPQDGKSALTVATEYLHLLPDDNIAKTDRRVTISDASMTFEAVGMELNSETRVLKLYAEVKGAYHDANALANAKRDPGRSK